MYDSVHDPHRRQPTRRPRPWDSPGKNTGVGCHCLLQCMKVESESEVAQSCLTLSDPMDCSLPGSSIHGIFRATVLEWGAIAFSYNNPRRCILSSVLTHTYPLFRRRQWHPTPVLLPRKSHGWRSLVGCSPRGHKESDTTERLHFPFSVSCIGEGNGNPFQSSCRENPRDGGAWWAAIYGVTQSRT